MFSIFGQWKTIFHQMHLLPDLPIKVCLNNFVYHFFYGVGNSLILTTMSSKQNHLPSVAISKFPAGQLTFQPTSSA